MTYSIDTDVSRKISHITIATGLNISDFREEAYGNMNILLRKKYVVPIDSTDATDTAFLKSIESDLAAGMLVLDIAASTKEDSELDKYGQYLVDKGTAKVEKIIEGTVVIIGGEDNESNVENYQNPAQIQLESSDDYATFDRPMSGIENDAIEAKIDAERYDSLNDNEQL